MSGSLKLRRAVPQDVSAIYRLCTRLYDEAEFPLPPIDETKVLHTIVHAIGEGLAAVLSAERNGRWVIVGSIGMQPNVDWFSSEPSLRELWIYVVPEFRSFRAARMLVTHGRAVGAEHGLSFRMGVFGSRDMARKIKLYQRLGLQPVGVMFAGV